jgi:alpha-amylase/alpha-mannosidase (GH57 family)
MSGRFCVREISVGFLWHMHQPYYKDPVAGMYLMPWVRLHSIRGYYDMIGILGEYPEIRSTFNLVPSLLVQLLDYAELGFRDGDFLLSQKRPSDLTWEEKKQIVSRFFMCNPQTMIAPFPRFLNLYKKRGKVKTSEDLNAVAKQFSNQDLLDLQVLFNLAWTGFMARKDKDITDLIRKGRSYTESDKTYLLDYQIEIMKRIIPLYKKRLDEGQIEITTSPFYHPIGPLVMNVGYALRSMDTPLPDEPFSHPEDLNTQIERAIAFHEQVFGTRPKGLWPSEGSVCPEMIELLSNNGIRWTATDEDILFGSIRQSRTGNWLYQPYTASYGRSEVSIFFRDKPLSDQIGFVYSKNTPSQSVNDLMYHLENIYKAARGYDFDPFVSVILDGENPWEYYPDGGEGFLRGLYERLGTSQEIKTSQFNEFLERNPTRQKIPNLYTGSWINHNFRIWIGHEEDRRAWEYLARTRNYVESKGKDAHPLAWEGIYIAEGSDWFWWYGDEFNTDNDEEFDRIFRLYLRNCYELHNDPVPAELYRSIITPHDITPLMMPVGFINPFIDGTITHFYEWRKAGCYQPSGNTKNMYNQIQYISSIFYGFDVENLFVRIDFSTSVKDMVILLHVVSPKIMHLQIPFTGKPMTLYRMEDDHEVPICDLDSVAYRTILEFSVPFTKLSALPPQRMRFYLSLMKDDLEVERHPMTGVLSFPIPDKGYERVMWYV